MEIIGLSLSQCIESALHADRGLPVEAKVRLILCNFDVEGHGTQRTFQGFGLQQTHVRLLMESWTPLCRNKPRALEGLMPVWIRMDTWKGGFFFRGGWIETTYAPVRIGTREQAIIEGVLADVDSKVST